MICGHAAAVLGMMGSTAESALPALRNAIGSQWSGWPNSARSYAIAHIEGKMALRDHAWFAY